MYAFSTIWLSYRNRNGKNWFIHLEKIRRKKWRQHEHRHFMLKYSSYDLWVFIFDFVGNQFEIWFVLSIVFFFFLFKFLKCDWCLLFNHYNWKVWFVVTSCLVNYPIINCVFSSVSFCTRLSAFLFFHKQKASLACCVIVECDLQHIKSNNLKDSEFVLEKQEKKLDVHYNKWLKLS